MSNPQPEEFADAGAAMQDLQARLDKTAEQVPRGCASDLRRASAAITDALETYHEVHEGTDD